MKNFRWRGCFFVFWGSFFGCFFFLLVKALELREGIWPGLFCGVFFFNSASPFPYHYNISCQATRNIQTLKI